MKNGILFVLLLVVLSSACKAQKNQISEIQFVSGEAFKAFPFSEVVRVGNMLYLSGQIGTDQNLKVVSGGIAAETRQTMENIKAVLERNGSSLDRVVKVTVFIADMKEWPEMNKVYATYFPNHFPARSALGANGLALGAKIEIECIAVVK